MAQIDNRVLLARENALLREQLADRDETIRRLWERVSAEAEERREVQRRLTAVLTHRQAGSVPAVIPRPAWWQRWLP